MARETSGARFFQTPFSERAVYWLTKSSTWLERRRIPDAKAEEEAIEQRGQLLTLVTIRGRQLVAGAEQSEQRYLDDFLAVVKKPLVDQRQDRIQDRRVGFEDFIEEGDMGFGKFAAGDAPIVVLFESLETDRAENLLRRLQQDRQFAALRRL